MTHLDLQKRFPKRNAHHMCGWDDAHKWNLNHILVCNHDVKNMTCGLCAHGITLAFMCWSCAQSLVLCSVSPRIPLMVTLSLVSCSISPSRCNTQHTLLSFLDFVVRFCVWSHIVFCRQFLSVANSCKTCHLMCCLHTPIGYSRPRSTVNDQSATKIDWIHESFSEEFFQSLRVSGRTVCQFHHVED